MQRFFFAKQATAAAAGNRSNIFASSNSSSTDSAVSSSSSVSPSSCESMIDSDMGSPNTDTGNPNGTEFLEISMNELAEMMKCSARKLLIMDCRNFVDYNHCHIAKSINTLYSRIMRKRLVDNKLCCEKLVNQYLENIEESLSIPSFDGINVVIYAGDESTRRLTNHRTGAVSKLRLTCPQIVCGTNNNSENCDDASSSEKCAKILFDRLQNASRLRCKKVMLLKGSFVEFRQQFPDLCESNEPNPVLLPPTPSIESAPLQPSNGFVMNNWRNNNCITGSTTTSQHPETGPSTSAVVASQNNKPMTLLLSAPNRLSLPNSFSHPNLSTSSPCVFPSLPYKGDNDEPSNGPTQILDFLFLGSQQDALNPEVLNRNGITKIINLSEPGARAESIRNHKNYFLHIPINDSYQAKLLPHFDMAYEFLESARNNGEKVLVHCLAGISRSATLAIAYIMRNKRLSSDEAYKFVKALRPSISPNFNFMGQLLEYEKQLRERQLLSPASRPHSFAATQSSDSPMEQCNDLFLAPPDQRICKSASANDVLFAAPKREGLNENGKRTIGAPLSFPERPRQLMKTNENEFFARPGSIPLTPSTTPVTTELPSPSTELKKLDISSHLPSLKTPDCSEAPSLSLSIENPMFDMAPGSAPVLSKSNKVTFNPTAALRAHCKESIIRCLRKNKGAPHQKKPSPPKVIDPCSSRCVATTASASSSAPPPTRRFLQRRFFQQMPFATLATVTDLPDDEAASTSSPSGSPIKTLKRSGSISSSSQPTGSISPLVRSSAAAAAAAMDSDDMPSCSHPYSNDPERESIGSASSLEIAVN